MDVTGVALRDQQVDFFVGGAQAAAANEAQRTRLSETLRGLDDTQWAARSRCSRWSVQDVARHLAQMADVMRQGIRAGRAGERLEVFKNFDPKETPDQMVRAAGSQGPDATLADFDEVTRDLVDLVNQLTPDENFLSVTPAGRQPWPRAILHGLFDSAVHERDIAGPLGIPVAAGTEETSAIAAYQTLLTARVACMFGAQAAFELQLTGACGMAVHIDGPHVQVSDQTGAGAPVCTGDAVAVLDAMTGRGELAEVLDAPTDVVALLSTLRALV